MHAVRGLGDDKKHEVLALAARQRRLVAARQLVALGVSRTVIAGWVRARWLHPKFRGVYAVGTPELDRLGEFMAAALACGPTAALSHRSAAHVWDMRRHDRGPVDVTVARTGARSRPGINVHVSRALTWVIHDGLRVSTPERTLTDLLDVLTPAAHQQALARAERGRLADRHTMSPLPGRRRVGTGAHVFTRSQNEAQMYRVLSDRGIILPLVNQDMGANWEADFFWPEHRLVVEIDSYFTHGNPRSFETDRLKDEYLQDRGLLVRRITDTRLHHEEDAVAASISRALCGGPRR